MQMSVTYNCWKVYGEWGELPKLETSMMNTHPDKSITDKNARKLLLVYTVTVLRTHE